MKIKPLQDRVIVKRIDQEEEVRGGIVIPDTAKEKPQEGEIVAAGDMTHLERNYLDKHDALNRTAWALTENGLSFVAACNLHK